MFVNLIEKFRRRQKENKPERKQYPWRNRAISASPVPSPNPFVTKYRYTKSQQKSIQRNENTYKYNDDENVYGGKRKSRIARYRYTYAISSNEDIKLAAVISLIVRNNLIPTVTLFKTLYHSELLLLL